MLPYLIVKRDKMKDMIAWAENNIRPIPNWGALSKAGVKEIERLYREEKLTQRQIAEKFHVTHGAVSSFFLRKGIKGRRSGPQEGAYGILAKHGKKKLFSMYESGMTMNEIAEELQVRVGTVRMYFWKKHSKLTKKIRRAREKRRNELTAGNA